MDAAQVIATARRVLTREAEAVAGMAAALPDGFVKAAVLLEGASGRVIVSGMGKSGHVARKIAATLASTGTPAMYVHPGEASHGDLGMLAQGDVILALSNSGETPELADLIAYSRRFRIPLIAMTAKADSALGRQSDVVLALPAEAEACTTGYVPTTSTAMMMALGDALALALMEHRAFTPEHFRTFHPGGRLGARLLRVTDLMHTDMPLVTATTKMSEALLVMSRIGFGVVGVVGVHDYLEGIVTDGDLRRHMDGLLSRTAGDVMTRQPLTIAPGALAEEAVALMNERRITCLFVSEPQQPPRGLIHIHDCLRAGIA